MSEYSLQMLSDHSQRRRPGWTFAIVSVALFMVVLDNLVVTTALPSIRADLGGGLQALEWTVNAYTLTFAGGDHDAPGQAPPGRTGSARPGDLDRVLGR